MKGHKTADEYITSVTEFKDIVVKLRSILLKTGLKEEVKWGIPCYTFSGKNVAGIAAFKEYAGLWFYQGVLLEDGHNVLINAQEGKTAALRQWRFTHVNEVDENVVVAYVEESVENFRQGRVIKPNRKKPLVIPDELINAMNKNAPLRDSFEDLKLSFKREYCDYISEAKRLKTKSDRLEKIIPMILEGKGLHDKYR